MVEFQLAQLETTAVVGFTLELVATDQALQAAGELVVVRVVGSGVLEELEVVGVQTAH